MSARRLKSTESRNAATVFDRQAKTDPVVRAVLDYLCEVENRLLKLEGETALDAVTFKAAFKARVTGE